MSLVDVYLGYMGRGDLYTFNVTGHVSDCLGDMERLRAFMIFYEKNFAFFFNAVQNAYGPDHTTRRFDMIDWFKMKNYNMEYDFDYDVSSMADVIEWIEIKTGKLW